MTERPILFSGPMVKAILDGRKTQTRRVMKPAPESRENTSVPGHFGTFFHGWNLDHPDVLSRDIWNYCPYGEPGHTMWVRETFAYVGTSDPGYLLYRASDYDEQCQKHDFDPSTIPDISDVKWKPSIHMPKVACRLFLRIKDIRVERLQDIGDEDVAAEGETPHPMNEPAVMFQKLWDSINAKKHPWESNPWVWVVEFSIGTPQES